MNCKRSTNTNVYTKMNQSDINAVYNNMVNLLKEEITLSYNNTDKSQLSYRLRNIITFILEHYDVLMSSNEDVIIRHMTDYFDYAINVITNEYNELSNTKLSTDEKKTHDDYKKTLDYVERFRKRCYV
jgi:hypothetical protein